MIISLDYNTYNVIFQGFKEIVFNNVYFKNENDYEMSATTLQITNSMPDSSLSLINCSIVNDDKSFVSFEMHDVSSIIITNFTYIES
jgi:hypothetical protein